MLLAHSRAVASPFCPADMAFLVPWDYASDAPSSGDSSLHYAFRLQADNGGTLSGHMTLASDTKEYAVAFNRVDFTASDDEDSDGYKSDGDFISLPENAAIRYAWVTDVTDASGKTTNCPIFPFAVPKLTDAQRQELAPKRSVPKGLDVEYHSLSAEFKDSLAPANCPEPYRKAAPDGDIPSFTRAFDGSIAHKPIVEGAVAVDATGHALGVAIWKSSGSITFDDDARDTYGRQKFNPALFDCKPVVGEYYFSLQYYQPQ